jgi:hypothetical protein
MSEPPLAAADGGKSTSHHVALQLRVAASLCAIVGVLSLFRAILMGPPSGNNAVGWLSFAVNVITALLMCGAAIWTWKARRVAAYALVLAYFLPNALNLATGHGFQWPSVLLLLAFLVQLHSWHLLAPQTRAA